MELKFKPKSKKSKKGEIYYKKSRFFVSSILNKSPKTWSELIKLSGLHQIELKRILDDLLSSKEVKKEGGGYLKIKHPYYKYLDSPLRLKNNYIKKINESKLEDIHVFDPIMVLPLDKTKFNTSEIEEIDKNCQSVLESTINIDKIIRANRRRFIQEEIEREIQNSRPPFKKSIKKNSEEIASFISSLSKIITTKDVREILKIRNLNLYNFYKKFSYSYRSKFLKLIIKISEETWREFPIILSTTWI